MDLVLDQMQREQHLADAPQRLEQAKFEQKKKVEQEKKLDQEKKLVVKSMSPEALAQALQAGSPEKREELLAADTSSHVVKKVADKHGKPIERPRRPMYVT